MINTRRDFLKVMGTGAVAGPLSANGFPSCGVAAEFTDQTTRSATQKSVCTSIRDLGLQFLDNRLRITGQDGATSSRLPNGDAFWMFGDTIEGPFETIRNHDLTEVLSNTASVVPSQDVAQGIRQFEYLKSADQKRPRQVIEFGTDENRATHRLWPIHSICVNNTIYAFYHKITMDPRVDVFETFELNGMGIARAQVGEYRFERMTAPDGSKEFWKGNQPGFGVFIEKLADGYLYLWGSYWTGMFLARTRADAIEDLASYEYLVSAPTLVHPGKAVVWQKTFQPSAVLFDGVPNELSVAYNSYLKKHIAIHVLNRDNKLAIRTAPHIYGPWSEPEIFFRPQRKSADDLFTAGKEHPELRREDGKILYVTYVNSSMYAPHLLEVTLV
ncbi:MAG: DUF4185 domain-containing protein [Pirellulales bacterium]